MSTVTIIHCKELNLTGKRRILLTLQNKLGNLLRIIARQLQHAHTREIDYLNRLLESSCRQLSDDKKELFPAYAKEIISQEKELRGLLQEYRFTNQKLGHLLNQLPASNLKGKAGPIFLKQSWYNLKQFYYQQEEKEKLVISKYKKFKQRVNNPQKSI